MFVSNFLFVFSVCFVGSLAFWPFTASEKDRPCRVENHTKVDTSTTTEQPQPVPSATPTNSSSAPALNLTRAARPGNPAD
ncbi:unnamed protein product [Caenorhabditis auriculariae]|uniref:Uncharacterized protein n=1 Tax=Caenorhabditis auriculariae TaxID=2777116 RepID=A0A8S1HDJ5_9PELO|nr:unnamed protein product [Caenorhabditis auriculariae]